MHVHSNYLADSALRVWARDAEVGQHRLKNMHIMDVKTANKRHPKNVKKGKEKKDFFGCCCCWTCSGRARTWGNLDLKKDRDRKKQKKDWKICFTPHKWLICMAAARSARPATAATAAATTATTTTATLGSQVCLGHPLHHSISMTAV